MPLCQPQQHNTLIKSDNFACYFMETSITSASSQLPNVAITRFFSHPKAVQKKLNQLPKEPPIFPFRALDPVLLFSVYHEY